MNISMLSGTLQTIVQYLSNHLSTYQSLIMHALKPTVHATEASTKEGLYMDQEM